MSVQVRRRREAATFLSTFVGAQGELLVDTTNNRVQIHDGATPGGWPAARLADLPSSTSPLALAQGGTGINAASPNALLTALGAIGRTTVADASYPALASDRTIAFTALSAARAVTLPAASVFPTGTALTIFDESGACSATNAITISRAGTDTINGASTVTISTPYGYVALESNGTAKWTVIDSVVAASSSSSSSSTAASSLTGAVLASTVVTSSLTSVGTLTGGATGAGFTVALGTSALTGSLPVANGGTGGTSSTGSGSNVLSNSPTLVSPTLGTPQGVTLTYGTGLPIATGLSGAGSGVLTALANAVGSAGAPLVFGGVLGAPSSGNLTNTTGFPLANLSGAATGVLTALAVAPGNPGSAVINGGALGTPSGGSAANLTNLPISGLTGLGTNVATALSTPATGTGALVLATSATLVTPNLGTPSAINLANASALPLTTGVVGTLPIANGGTGATSPVTAAVSLGLVGRAAASDANVTATAASRTIAYTSITAPRSVTLPAASGFPTGTTLLIVDESGACSATNTITLTCAGSDKINGAASAILALGYGYLALNSNGSNAWTIVDQSTGSMGQQSAAGVAVTGGTINGTAIGTTTAAAVAATSLSATGSVTLPANSLTLAMEAQAPATTLRGNLTGTTANVADSTLTGHMDAAFGTAIGQILMRGTSGWSALVPSPSSGFVLTSNGSGNLPSYQASGSGGSGSAVLRGYLAGLSLSNDPTTPNTLIDIAVGVATSDDASTSISLGSAFTKSIGSNWASASGNGGLDTGTAAASTWYHVYLIQNPTTPSVDALISMSPTSPTLPSGYTKKRRIGSIRTDASSHILAFSQFGDEFIWSVAAGDVSNVAISTTPLTSTLTVPTGVKVTARVRTLYTSATINNGFLLNSPDETPVAVSSPLGNFTGVVPSANGYFSAGLDIRTNTLGQIRAVANGAGNYYVVTYGWIDTRGRFT